MEFNLAKREVDFICSLNLNEQISQVSFGSIYSVAISMFWELKSAEFRVFRVFSKEPASDSPPPVTNYNGVPNLGLYLIIQTATEIV